MLPPDAQAQLREVAHQLRLTKVQRRTDQLRKRMPARWRNEHVGRRGSKGGTWKVAHSNPADAQAHADHLNTDPEVIAQMIAWGKEPGLWGIHSCTFGDRPEIQDAPEHWHVGRRGRLTPPA
jgi:hypothetical protein